MSNEQRSLADRAVETLAAVRAMDDGVSMEHPERHTVRELKATAEQIREHTLILGRTCDGMADPAIQSLSLVTQIGASDGVKQLLAPPKNRPFYRQFVKGKF